MKHHLHVAVLCIIALAIIAGLEIGVFNAAHWRTTDLPAVESGTPVIGDGLEQTDDHTFTVTDPETATIDIPVHAAGSDAPATLRSIRLVAQEGYVSTATLYTSTDEATESAGTDAGTDTGTDTGTDADTDSFDWEEINLDVWYDADRSLRYTSVDETQYVLVPNVSEERASTWLRISYETEDTNATVTLESIELNPTVPLSFHASRFIIEIAVALFLIAFRPGSMLWRRRLDITTVSHKVATGAFIVAHCLVLYGVTTLVRKASQPVGFEYISMFSHWRDAYQYQYLGHALLQGHTWLDLPVDNTLLALDNPYDYSDRLDMADMTGAQYFWDHAYFDGHYYCYFGVLPAVLMFAPFEAITGRWLPSWAATLATAIVFTVFGTLAVMKFLRRYFPQVSQAMAWLCTLTFLVANSVIYYLYSPSFYGIPTVAADACLATGLYFWISARRRVSDGAWAADPGDADARVPGQTKLSAWRMVLGAALLAMTVGCRPQFAVAVVLLFPMFWDEIRHSRQLFSRSSWRLTAAVFVTMAAVVAPLLWYNAVRFGSPLDFGSNYNLTAYDMTQVRPSRYLLIQALFLQLFQPVSISGSFPFFSVTDNTLPLPNEPSLGGLFAIVPFLMLGLMFWIVRKQLRSHRVWGFTCLSLALGLAVCIIDVIICGVNNRYYGDCGHLLALAAIAVAASLEGVFQARRRHSDATVQTAKATQTAGSASAQATASVTTQPAQATQTADPASSQAAQVTASVTTQPVTADADSDPTAEVFALVLAGCVLFSLVITFGGLFATGRFDPVAFVNPWLFESVRSWFLGLCM